jgi:RNA polymerase sigma factor (sigma-70 family)
MKLARNGGLARIFRNYNMRNISDGELLRLFRTNGDQESFTELMDRHSRMVVNAARAVVGDTVETEDIAQAAFLTLARKAGSLEESDSLGAWLYHVAVCLARNARQKRRRREAREMEAVMIAGPSDETSGPSDAALAALHEELAGLSESYRAPVILHHLEGKSYEEAAAELRCNPNTFAARLTRAREKLRKRLVGRGVALGATALVAGLSQNASAAELPAAVVSATCKAAGMLAAGTAVTGGLVSANVAALMEGAMKMLWIAKVKSVVLTCAIAAVVVAGVSIPVGMAVAQAMNKEAANKKEAPEKQVVAATGNVTKPTVQDTLALERPFRFYGDHLSDALEEVKRRLPAASPLRFAVIPGYNWTAMKPGPGTDQKGYLFWTPADNGSCTVQSVLEQIASSFGLRLTIAGDVAVFHRTLDEAAIAAAIKGDPTPLLDDPNAWLEVAVKALDDTNLAARVTLQGWENDDVLRAALPCDAGVAQRVREILRSPLASTPAQVQVALNLLEVMESRPGDAQLLVDLLGQISAPKRPEEWLNSGDMDGFAYGLLARLADPAVKDWLGKRAVEELTNDDWRTGVPPSEDGRLAWHVLATGSGGGAFRALRTFSASGGDPLAFIQTLNMKDDLRAQACIGASVRCPQKAISGKIREIVADGTLWQKAAAAYALLRRGETDAIKPALDMFARHDLPVDVRVALLGEVIRLATSRDVPEINRLLAQELVGIQQHKGVGGGDGPWCAYLVLKSLADRGDLEVWKTWLPLLQDPATSDDLIKLLASGISRQRDDAADAALAACAKTLPANRAKLIADATRRSEPHQVPMRTLAENHLKQAKPTNAVAHICEFGRTGGGDAFGEVLHETLANQSKPAWLRGAALLGLEDFSGKEATTFADLQQAFKDPDGYVRAVACWKVGANRGFGQDEENKKVHALVVQALADSDLRVRAYAAFAFIAHINLDKDIRQILIRQATQDPAPQARQAAALVLAVTIWPGEDLGDDSRKALSSAAKDDQDPAMQSLCEYLLQGEGISWSFGGGGTRVVRSGSSGGVTKRVRAGNNTAVATVVASVTANEGASTENDAPPKEGNMLITPPRWTEKPEDMPVPLPGMTASKKPAK